jgi:hypothetical protein
MSEPRRKVPRYLKSKRSLKSKREQRNADRQATSRTHRPWCNGQPPQPILVIGVVASPASGRQGANQKRPVIGGQPWGNPGKKKRARGWGTTGPVAALEVWVFGGGEQPLKRSVCVLRGGAPRLKEQYPIFLVVSNPGRDFDGIFSPPVLNGRLRACFLGLRVVFGQPWLAENKVPEKLPEMQRTLLADESKSVGYPSGSVASGRLEAALPVSGRPHNPVQPDSHQPDSRQSSLQ